MRISNRWTCLAFVIISSSTSLEASPVFNYVLGAGVSIGDPVYNGFVQAGQAWDAVLRDNVTVSVQISYQSLGTGILGSTSNSTASILYSAARTGLIADSKTADDATAVAHLQSPSGLSFGMNHTSDCGNCTTPYLDNNSNYDNTHVKVSCAEAKALGVTALTSRSCGSLDGSITFSSNYSFDFDPSDGISPGLYDFVGVATHEIGHLLGFISSVDDYDYCAAATANCGGPIPEASDAPTVLDLYRYSNALGTGNIMDETSDARAKYFSIDGGATLGPQFSTGTNFGDGRQASHWKDNLGIGIMDPTAAPGERLSISQYDVAALDVIGWDAAVTTTPEPASTGMLVMGLAAIYARRRRRCGPAN